MRTTSKRLWITLIAVAAMVLTALPIAGANSHRNPPKGGVVELKVIQYSDWHGQLDPLFVFGQGTFGGAAELATYFAQERAENPNTLIITGGDDFGGTPPLASFFNEEPAVLAQNLMGTDISTLGNHNFDRGVAHLQEMIDLADYPYVSANLANVDDNLDGVEPYKIFHFPGIKVAVIGVTNEEAPSLVFPGSFGTIQVTDASDAAQGVRDRLARRGVDVFILVAHMGVQSMTGGVAQGDLIDLAESVEGFDLILGDHTDFQYEGIHNGALVTEARSKGRDYARINLTVKAGKGGVLGKSVEFVEPISANVTPDQAVVDLLQPLRDELSALLDEKIGTTSAFWPRGGGYERIGEAEVGNLMADSFLNRYGTQLALTNSGGIRSPLPSSYVPAPGSGADRDGVFPDDILLGDVFNFHNFGNDVVTRTVSGATLHAMLEHGLGSLPNSNGKFPQIAGFRVIYNSAAASGSRVIGVQLTDGTPIPSDGTLYTIALPDFVNEGGDDYLMLADGQGTTREPLTQVVELEIRARGTIAPFFDCRLIDINPSGPAVGRQDCSDFLP